MLTINTNRSSLTVQANLAVSTKALNQAIERMTTGFKINHARDNAANYSISTNLASKLSSYAVAQENASMGLDMLTTAEDSLSLVSAHLSRIRDLAEQAANGTYGKDSLKAIQSEVSARVAECDRIIANTEYNGIKLFHEEENPGGPTNLPGAQYNGFIEEVDQLSEAEALAQGYTIIRTASDLQAMQNDLNGKYILMSDINLVGYNYTAVGASGRQFTGELNGNGHTVTISTVANNTGGIFGTVGAALIKNLGVEVDVLNYASGGIVHSINNGEIVNCYTIVNQSMGALSGGLAYQITGDVSSSYVTVNASVMNSSAAALAYIASGNISDSYSYFTSNMTPGRNAAAFVTSFSGGSIQNSAFYNPLGVNIPTVNSNNGGDISGLTEVDTPPPISGSGNKKYNIEVVFQVGIQSDPSSQIILGFELDYGIAVDVSSSNAARNSLALIDSMLSEIEAVQVEYGAVYNRLESALESISVSIDNLTSTQSTIRDADIAEESSAYIRNQILQQAASTLLATTNQTPSIALQLL